MGCVVFHSEESCIPHPQLAHQRLILIIWIHNLMIHPCFQFVPGLDCQAQSKPTRPSQVQLGPAALMNQSQAQSKSQQTSGQVQQIMPSPVKVE